MQWLLRSKHFLVPSLCSVISPPYQFCRKGQHHKSDPHIPGLPALSHQMLQGIGMASGVSGMQMPNIQFGKMKGLVTTDLKKLLTTCRWSYHCCTIRVVMCSHFGCLASSQHLQPVAAFPWYLIMFCNVFCCFPAKTTTTPIG